LSVKIEPKYYNRNFLGLIVRFSKNAFYTREITHIIALIPLNNIKLSRFYRFNNIIGIRIDTNDTIYYLSNIYLFFIRLIMVTDNTIKNYIIRSVQIDIL